MSILDRVCPGPGSTIGPRARAERRVALDLGREGAGSLRFATNRAPDDPPKPTPQDPCRSALRRGPIVPGSWGYRGPGPPGTRVRRGPGSIRDLGLPGPRGCGSAGSAGAPGSRLRWVRRGPGSAGAPGSRHHQVSWRAAGLPRRHPSLCPASSTAARQRRRQTSLGEELGARAPLSKKGPINFQGSDRPQTL